MSETIKNTFSGEGDRTSFYKLFKENDLKIVIPMLQRDYAQGREEVKEVRNEFLKALYTYLDEDIPSRDLDFVYGNIVNNEFIPLDGQQRLTTLFLLHWYLSRITPDKELRKEFDMTMLDSARHCRFTYKTRTSSSEFCDALMNQEIDFTNLKPVSGSVKGVNRKHSVKETIEDMNWFPLSWRHDPTISSMLTMLDAIHELFSDRADFLPRLLDSESPVITFLFMELAKYSLSDELYIKMNSRGKPLTAFENFKARYSEYIGRLNKTFKEPVTRIRTFKNGKQVTYPLDKYFAERIDNAWINMVWAYRDEEDREESLDAGQLSDRRMARLMSAILFLKYVELHPQTKGASDSTFGMLANQSGRDSLSFITLRDGDALSLASTEFLIDALDILCSRESKPEIRLAVGFEHCLDMDSLLTKIMLNPREFNYNDRVLLFAYLAYVLEYGATAGVNQWMRVIYNLSNAENHRIDSPSDVSNAIKSVAGLLPHATAILDYLVNGGKVEFFPSWLVEEERMKAALILSKDGEKWLSSILAAESHGYFTGQIGFLLEFSGIWDYFKKKGEYRFEEEDEIFFKRFTKYSADASAAFANSYENRINDKYYRFERAVLFKGDYLPSNNVHYNFLSTNTTKNNVKRDFTWKRLLRLDKDQEATERREFVKAVFDDSAYDSHNPNESLKKVFEGKTTGEQWRDWLIRYPSAIGYCEQGFIAFCEDVEGCEGVLPMCSSRLSGYHRELYTWGLYCDLKKYSATPFKKGIEYKEQRVNDELPFLYFDGFSIDRRNHWLAITADTDSSDWSLKRYCLEFIQEGSVKVSEGLSNLHELLKKDGFVEGADHKIWSKYLKDEKEVKKYLPSLFVRLDEFKASIQKK